MHTDLFATKGLEYLLVIAYLTLLTLFWTLAMRAPRPQPARAAAPKARKGWFSLPENLHFHQGHSWAAKEAPGLLRVGMDEFSRKLLGNPTRIRLPEVGANLEQGQKGWALEIDGKWVEMLAPVTGEVMAVNPDLSKSLEVSLRKPYDDGWLLKVRVDPERCPLRNLLTGELARVWMEGKEERIRRQHGGELGYVLPDGGAPVDGMARALDPDRWDDLVREILIPESC